MKIIFVYDFEWKIIYVCISKQYFIYQMMKKLVLKVINILVIVKFKFYNFEEIIFICRYMYDVLIQMNFIIFMLRFKMIYV